MRTFFSYLTLYGLLAVTVISIMPFELIISQEDKLVFYSEGEKENDANKEGTQKKKDKKSEKIIPESQTMDARLPQLSSPLSGFRFQWEAPHIPVFSPPPEYLLG